MSATNKVCIIGAGSSGIAVAKNLKEHNIPYDCYEAGSKIGGNWRYKNDNGMSSIYRSLHINSSKWVSAYPDYPMASSCPDYPKHNVFLEYLMSYADNFKLAETITFNTKVERVEPCLNGSWDVFTNQTNDATNYQALIVATGHHWKPHYIELEGQDSFDGKIMHSQSYDVPHVFDGKNVLVVGLGNSAMDIAPEVSIYADKTILSTRSGAHIIPKYIFGIPMVHFFTSGITKLPKFLQTKIFHLLFWLSRGSLSRFSLPKPEHTFWQTHPTVSSNIFMHIGQGDVQIKPDIRKLDKNKAYFSDNTHEMIDTIIFCTGYEIYFPFLSNSILPIMSNKVDLYLRMIHPEYNNLFFVGLVQPPGAIMPIAHYQSKLIANLLNSNVSLPSKDEMHKEIDRYHRYVKENYKTSMRHSIEVDYFSYLNQLKKTLTECM